MKKTLLKKLLAVSLALATLTFAGCQKEEPVNSDENPSENISQNDVVNQEETSQEVESTDKDEKESTKQEESSKKPVEDKTDKQDTSETKKPATNNKIIDLKSVELSKYGITSNHEISKPYSTSLGNVYLVRDYCEEYSSKTYLFVTTKEKVLVIDTGMDYLPSAIKLDNSYEIGFADLDGEKGEEIVLNMGNGGNGGAGGHDSYIYKIFESRIAEMEQPAEPDEMNGFSFRFKAPFKMVVTHECNNEEFVIEMKGNEEHEGFFDKNGTPERAEPGAMLDSYFIFEPVKLSDGSYGVRRVQYTWIASHANCAGWAETIIRYNINSKQFEVVAASFYDVDYDIYQAQ